MANVNEVKIVGIKLGVNKTTGKPSNTVSYEGPWSDYDMENGAYGVKAETRWTNADFSGVKIGDTVELIWQPGFQDKLQLVGYRLIKSGAKS